MNVTHKTFLSFVGVGAVALLSGCSEPEPLQFAGAACETPPVLHCPDKDCPGEMQINGGPVVEPQTGRTYFLDYPCDLKKGEDVTVVLNLHGGGSYGNWQRHYFPIFDYVGKYRLVVATPYAPSRLWSPEDDTYLENIVTSIIDQVGKDHVKAFWLAGHSMGGANSRRLVCSAFYRDKVDGFLSLSGGRIGSPPPDPSAPRSNFSIPKLNDEYQNTQTAPPPSAQTPGASGRPPGNGLFAILRNPPPLDCDFSHIFETGGHEPTGENLPDTSSWAEKYSCGPREKLEDVVDTTPGYVYDSTRQQYGTDAWGRLPRPGTAEVYDYPNCKDGRIVADVVRLDKGHTEGLEPKITEELVEMMVSAPGGKMRMSK